MKPQRTILLAVCAVMPFAGTRVSAQDGTTIFAYDFTHAGGQGSVDAIAGYPKPQPVSWAKPSITLQREGLVFSRDNVAMATVTGTDAVRVDWSQAGGFRLRFKLLIQEYRESKSARPIVARYNPTGDDRSWAVWIQQNQKSPRLTFLLSENGKDVAVLFTPEAVVKAGQEQEVVAEWIPGTMMRISVDGFATDPPVGRGVPAGLHPSKEPITIGGAKGVGFLKSAMIRSISMETVKPLQTSTR